MGLRETYKDLKLNLSSDKVSPGKIAWTSPSNIALVKYWGKHGNQLPSNPSLSFTLKNAFTETILNYGPRENLGADLDFSFFYEGEEKPEFAARIERFLMANIDLFPYLSKLNIRIDSKNTFPHSSGIASSASSMSALALCLCSLEDNLFDTLEEDSVFRKKASFISRLASGSACRSIYPKAAMWGHFSDVEDSNDEFAIPAADLLHPSFQDYGDAILIASSGTKTVSSSKGHELMHTHPYSDIRFKQADLRMGMLLSALRTGDLEVFIKIVENEALTLHGLMMTSEESYLLMAPNTLHIIEFVRSFRKDTGIPVCFSLDAGPNVHLLYPGSYQQEVIAFIEDTLLPFCEGRTWIDDKMGPGPVQVA